MSSKKKNPVVEAQTEAPAPENVEEVSPQNTDLLVEDAAPVVEPTAEVHPEKVSVKTRIIELAQAGMSKSEIEKTLKAELGGITRYSYIINVLKVAGIEASKSKSREGAVKAQILAMYASGMTKAQINKQLLAERGGVTRYPYILGVIKKAQLTAQILVNAPTADVAEEPEISVAV